MLNRPHVHLARLLSAATSRRGIRRPTATG